MSQMHNPYAEERCKAVFAISRPAAWSFAVIFMATLWIPPLWEHVAQIVRGNWRQTPAARLFDWRPGQMPITHHLQAVEKSLERSGYAIQMRQTLQEWLTHRAGQGNRKVHLGFEGMLFYRPDLRALSGYGPLKTEPFSVMKDPELAKLRQAREVILEFAAQLKERGIPLLLVPVPLKPMIYPELIAPAAGSEWITHPDAAAFYDRLRTEGIDVLDLTADLSGLRRKRKYVHVRVPDPKDKAAVAEAAAQAREMTEVFLAQDTHWTPEAMEFAAERVAAHVRKRFPGALLPRFNPITAVDSVPRESLGDLVKLLDLGNPSRSFAPEPVLLKVVAQGTEDRDSPVVLLGDSFVNVYDDPTLGFENPARPEERIRAGFAQLLSLRLQQPLDVIAMNGRGSTGVRRELAARPDDEVRAKKLVIWVIAARDLLLARSAAREANVEWGAVTFNPNRGSRSATPPPAGASLVVEARLLERSRNQDPNGSPYRDALHTALYEVEKVERGTLPDRQVLGVQWTFKDKQMQPPSTFAPGQRYRLTLTPWASKPDLKSINRQEDVLAFDAPMYFVEAAEPMK